MSTLALTEHARQRIVEFGLTLDVVAAIASRPDVTHRNTSGQVVCVADAHPDWTVVLGHDDVVVTVLRRMRERWEHSPTPARPPARQVPSTSAGDDVEVARGDDVPVRRAAIRRRSTVPPRSSSAVVRIDPDVLQLAREIADGDLRRLVLNRDGTVTILNKPRRTA